MEEETLPLKRNDPKRQQVLDALAGGSENKVMKYASLAWILVQNCAHNVLLKYSRSEVGCSDYSVSVVILTSEFVKLFTCMAMAISAQGVKLCELNMMASMLIPAVCFTLQNNIQFAVADHLDVNSIMILNQLKTLFTALCGICVLNRTLKWQQWVGLLMLMVGVITTQTNGLEFNSDVRYAAMSMTQSILSGFAATYVEKILKSDSTPLYARNIELALIAIPLQCATMFVNEKATWHAVCSGQMFNNFCLSTWAVTLMFAFGGLSTALVMRFADNNLKNISMAGSIILTSLVSVPLFGFHITPQFVVGSALVVLSIFMYGCV